MISASSQIRTAYHLLLKSEAALITAHRDAELGSFNPDALHQSAVLARQSAATALQAIAEHATPRHADPSPPLFPSVRPTSRALPTPVPQADL